jgi:hypothetical protein
MEVIASDKIPSQLPPHLSICLWGFYWLTYASPEEPYDDLERAVVETKERNFNCLRIDVAPDWQYDPQGNRRGPIELAPWVPGASRNNRCFSYKGNIRYDVHDRVIKLFELAAKYDLYLALTSWQFQETPPIAADPEIRKQILGIPAEQWFGHMAKAQDRLIREVKGRGLEKRIAYVEVHNEMNYFPGTEDERRCRSTEAIDFLRSRHPDLLITGDYAWIEKSFLVPNTQLIDHHVYAGKSSLAKFFCSATWDIDKGPDMKDDFLKWILRPDPEPWLTFLARANVNGFLHPAWLCRTWMYANLDNNRFDYWCFRNFGLEADEIQKGVVQKIKEGADLGRQMNLPVVVDEGYNLYPPLRSRFEESAAGRWISETAVHTAIEEGYWGIIPTGYFSPDEPAWHEEPQRTYLCELNEHILRGQVSRLLGPDRGE